MDETTTTDTTTTETTTTEPTTTEIDYQQLADTMFLRFMEGRNESGSLILLPSGEVHVQYHADLGDLLTSLLLFTLIAIQSFRWVSDTIRERKI